MSDLGSSSSGPPKGQSTGTVCTHLAAWCLCLRYFSISVGYYLALGSAAVAVLTRESPWLHIGTVGPLPVSF